MSVQNALKFIKDSEAKFVNFRFTDTLGRERHISFHAAMIDANTFENGKMLDGSSIPGWQSIENSDLIMLPDSESVGLDPFTEEVTANFRCDIINPENRSSYSRDPRSIAKRTESYFASTGIGDTIYCGPENEFFLFDSVSWSTEIGNVFYQVDSVEAAWNNAREYEENNTGHRPALKGGYFAVPPVDALSNVRAEMCSIMSDMGLEVEFHHHEVGTAGQCEISIKFDTLTKKADQVQIFKYVVFNAAQSRGLTATFMPKPLVGDNGSGMHIHQSLFKDNKNIFIGNEYGNLSKNALYYIGGVFKHARAINAFTNASTNSYRRLVPGFEAPVSLAYSKSNRSAACRIPYEANPQGRRIEIRFPDSSANPYLAFCAVAMAGIDGILNKIDPGKPIDKDLYKMTSAQANKIPTVATGLDMALEALDKDREFLTAGGVMDDDYITAYINLKMKEVNRLRLETHPCEFDMYYSL